MSDVPETRYARNGDVHVAYQVLGTGPPDLLVFSFGTLPIDAVGEEPSLNRFHRRLASFSRLIRFDLRGVGLSDPFSLAEPPTLEQWVQDAVAVLDAAGSERAAIFAPEDSSLEGVMLAATYPHRVSHLVMVNGTARVTRDDDYQFGVPRQVLDEFLEVNLEADALDRGYDFLAVACPSRSGDDAFRSWWVRAGNRGASPGTARALMRVQLHADVRPLLPLVRVPTLVMHRSASRVYREPHGRYLAEHIPGARFVALDGADHLYWTGDTTVMLDETEEFLTGIRHAAPSDRVLASVLFTDIVGSTARMAEVGETRWSELLDLHDSAVLRQIQRFGGRQIKATGDGILATFDGPARAVLCAGAIRDAAAQLGVQVRAGVHAGEIEVRGDDIAGMAVHIAARVEALADPGEILVSRTVVDLIVGSGIRFLPRGEHSLKGVPGTWSLFAVEA